MTVCLLKRKLNIQRYGKNHCEAIMNLAHSRRKMKDDLCEAYTYLPFGFSWFITCHRNVAGGPSSHPHAHRPWLVTCWTQREPCKCGWTLGAELSFWRRNFVPLWDASSLIIPSSQLFTLKYLPKLVFSSQSRFQLESFMQPTVRWLYFFKQ